MKHTTPNPKLVAAIQQAEQSKADCQAQVVEAMNPNTKKYIQLLFSIKNKVEKSQINDGLYTVKLTGDEAANLIFLCLHKVHQYEKGTDHACEYEKDGYVCIVCGGSL